VGIPRANASLWLFTAADTLKDRALRADAIPIGRVTATESSWQNGKLVTAVTFRVRDTLKGKLPPEIVVFQAGGTKDGIRAEVSDAPEFHRGDDSILFLRDLKDDPVQSHFAVVDRTLGKLDISRDEAGREMVRVVRPEQHRIESVRLTDLTEEVTSAVREKRQ
jgi:hypothetical protein